MYKIYVHRLVGIFWHEWDQRERRISHCDVIHQSQQILVGAPSMSEVCDRTSNWERKKIERERETETERETNRERQTERERQRETETETESYSKLKKCKAYLQERKTIQAMFNNQ